MLSSDSAGVGKAKHLRRNMTLPEVLLWRELRNRPAGLKFRRQHPAGRYTLDFYCDEANLCVEVDGIAHDMGENPSRDMERDAWLKLQGVTVLRIPAKHILSDLPAAVETIIAIARSSP